jgi:hypothetical protein
MLTANFDEDADNPTTDKKCQIKELLTKTSEKIPDIATHNI